MKIALHSSDPVLLRQRASGLGLPLFDKLECEQLMEWVEQEVAGYAVDREKGARVTPVAQRTELVCSLCGYGIVSREHPDRCPMCGGRAAWAAPSGSMSRRAALHEQLAG
jgi:hypothetical protein